GSFLCVPKERNRKKGHPGLCAPHLKYRCGVPSLVARLRGSAEGPSLSLRRTRGVPPAPVPARSSPSLLPRLE
ncbi:MAG: hypothetical protein ACYSTI_14035, partial [Planctomycetota bacterium]